jgi:hypothetical protein
MNQSHDAASQLQQVALVNLIAIVESGNDVLSSEDAIELVKHRIDTMDPASRIQAVEVGNIAQRGSRCILNLPTKPSLLGAAPLRRPCSSLPLPLWRRAPSGSAALRCAADDVLSGR